MSMKEAWRGDLMTDEFAGFLENPNLWRPAFPEGSTREDMAAMVLHHLMVPNISELPQTSDAYLESVLAKVKSKDIEPDQLVVSILTEQVNRLTGGSAEMDDIEQAARTIADVMNYVGFQYAQHMMRTGQPRVPING